MPDKIEFNETITVGGQPSSEELQNLKQQGFKSIINLRTQGEEDETIPPDEEAEMVRQLGMEYVHVPVPMDAMSEEKVNTFRNELARVPKPVYVHCNSGKRAGAFTMMDTAVKQNMRGEAAIQKAEEMGFECDVPEIEAFVKNYVNSHTSK